MMLYVMHFYGIKCILPNRNEAICMDMNPWNENGIFFFYCVVEQDVVEVCNALSDCVAEWTTLGIFLGIKKAQIDTIDAKTPYSGLLMDTLDYWLNNTTDRSWEALIKAVRDVNHTKLANELSKEYLENKQ